jgi:hypothetical protein
MQVRSSNMSVASAGSTKHNPMIIACDRYWEEIYRAPLDQIKGMAYGVREDYESGYRGMKSNWCTSPDSRNVHGWTVVA